MKSPEDLIKEAQSLSNQMFAEGGDAAAIEKYMPLIKDKMYEAALSYPEYDEESIGSALSLVDSYERWNVFTQIYEEHELSPKAFAKGLKYAWATGCGTGEACLYFMKVDGRLMMDEKELAFYEALPDEVELFRGCEINELNYLKEDSEDDSCMGISWTTDRGVAEFFAFRFGTDDRVVVSTVVHKSRIITCFSPDTEKECICLCPDEVTIITREKTNYYDDFMSRKDRILSSALDEEN